MSCGRDQCSDSGNAVRYPPTDDRIAELERELAEAKSSYKVARRLKNEADARNRELERELAEAQERFIKTDRLLAAATANMFEAQAREVALVSTLEALRRVAGDGLGIWQEVDNLLEDTSPVVARLLRNNARYELLVREGKIKDEGVSSAT